MTQPSDGNGLDDTKGHRMASVARALLLLDVRLRRLRGVLHQSSPEPPFQLTLRVTTSVAVADGIAIYEVAYEFTAQDRNEKQFLDGEIALNVLYRLPDEGEFSEDDLLDFGQASVVYTSHPYLREILHSLTSRMGLPPIVVEAISSPLDVPDDKNDDYNSAI